MCHITYRQQNATESHNEVFHTNKGDIMKREEKVTGWKVL